MRFRPAAAIALATTLTASLAFAEGSASESNRQGKMAYAGAEAGLGFLLPASGGEAGYFITPDLVAALNYIQSDLSVGDALKLNAKLITARAFYYFGNSFYVNAGLGLRTYKVDVSLENAVVGAGDVKESVSTSNLGLDVGIGNRWQWSGFWLGVDWAGYFLPVTKSGDDKVNVSGANPDDVKSAQNDMNSLASAGTPHLLRLSLGWAF
jgi:hypothetical protein